MARKSRKNTDTAVIAAPAAKTWNVGAYVRLSAVDKKQKGDSIENQQAIIAAYCDEHPELVIRETYIEARDIIEPTQRILINQGFRRVGSNFIL
jgi:hypothetical protein